jgi:hypothetical protein
MATWIIGSHLSPAQQNKARSIFVNRFTRQHRPNWAQKPRDDGQPYKPHFKDDADWLANTEFAVNKDGTLDQRVGHCSSNPTWPDGK